MLGHTNTSINKSKSIGSFVGDDLDFEWGLVFSGIGVSERFVSNFVEGVWGIGDEFSKEDLFVGVEGVDDESHELLDVSIESKVLCVLSLGHFWYII